MCKAVRIKGVYFSPCVGSKYRESELKLLILGESHYGKGGAEDLSEITVAAVGDGKHRFFVSVRRLFDGGEDFWEEVAFYNYVQELAGCEPRQRPTEKMWACSHAAFGLVLKKLQPDRILVVGKTTWLNKADQEQDYQGCSTTVERDFKLGSKFVQNMRKEWDEFRYARWYPTAQGKYALAAGIFHPAYPPGFSLAETKSVARRLLDAGWKPPA